MEKSTLQSPYNDRLTGEQIKQLYALAPVGMIATLVNASVVTFILRRDAPYQALLPWFLALVIITLLRAGLLCLYRRAHAPQHQLRRWGRWFIAGIALSGAAWGAGIVLFPHVSPAHQVFLAFVLGGMVAGASSTYIALRGAFLAYSTPVLVPLAIRFFLAGSGFHIAMGEIVILYGVLIFVTAERNHSVNRTSLTLRFENMQLIDNLEKTVADRTAELRVINALLTSQISDRIRAEAALHRSEEQYRTLFERNPAPMWVYDKRTLSFLAVNNAAVSSYGYSRGEFLKMTIKDIHPPEDVPRLFETIKEVRGEYRAPGIWRQRKKNGALIDAEITTHDITFNGREARLVLAIDVSARRRFEETVRDPE